MRIVRCVTCVFVLLLGTLSCSESDPNPVGDALPPVDDLEQLQGTWVGACVDVPSPNQATFEMIVDGSLVIVVGETYPPQGCFRVRFPLDGLVEFYVSCIIDPGPPPPYTGGLLGTYEYRLTGDELSLDVVDKGRPQCQHIELRRLEGPQPNSPLLQTAPGDGETE